MDPKSLSNDWEEVSVSNDTSDWEDVKPDNLGIWSNDPIMRKMASANIRRLAAEQVGTPSGVNEIAARGLIPTGIPLIGKGLSTAKGFIQNSPPIVKDIAKTILPSGLAGYLAGKLFGN